MLWYYAWQRTAISRDFLTLTSPPVQTKNSPPISCLISMLVLGDVYDWSSISRTIMITPVLYWNSLTPTYKKTGRHPPFITSSKKVKDHRLFRISSPIQQLWVIQILFLLSLEADIETHILHESYEAAIPPLKNVRHTVYWFRSQNF